MSNHIAKMTQMPIEMIENLHFLKIGIVKLLKTHSLNVKILVYQITMFQ